MRYVLVCPDDFLHQLLHGTAPARDAPLYLVADPGVRARIARSGSQALSGNLDDPAIYRRAFRRGREAVVVAAPAERLGKILTALRAVAPQTPVLALRDEEELPSGLPTGVTTLPISAFALRVIQPELERAGGRSVRNVGYVKSAGDVVRAAFGDLGAAGGHRAMAKAVIPLVDWRAELGDLTAEGLRQGVMERFLRALGATGQGARSERG